MVKNKYSRLQRECRGRSNKKEQKKKEQLLNSKKKTLDNKRQQNLRENYCQQGILQLVKYFT